MFSVALLPLTGAVGTAVDYSRASAVRSSFQAALDASALATIKIAASLPPDQITLTARNFFNASFNRSEASNVNVSAQYDANAKTITLTGSGTVQTSFMGIFGFPQLNVGTSSGARIGKKQWQICVMITDPDSNHVLMTKGGAQINFDNCMVQANTQNWDAVEARDTSWIRSTNGENCFVGDIHYGDVTPPKNPSCTFFPDPFASYNVPTNSCDFTNKVVNSPATLSPGTYCGGIKISANATLSPGVYYIQDGDLAVSGSANMTANNVTFLLSGQNSNINITTTGTITLSPNTNAGQWSGFVFYFDQPTTKNNKSSGGKSWIKNATVNASGVIYLVGQSFNIANNAVVNISPGSVLAHEILPDSGAKVNVTGSLNSGIAVLNQLKKEGSSSAGAVLTR